MTRKDVKEKILKFNQEAKEQAQKACSLAESISREEMIQCVHTYVCSKFFLDMSDSKEKLLYQMAEQSIEKFRLQKTLRWCPPVAWLGAQP